MAAAAGSAIDYRVTCTVAVAHPASGRGSNETALTETIVDTLRRNGYSAAVHPLLGFGSAATMLPESLPIGPVVTVLKWICNKVSDRIEKRRQKELDSHLPACVVQLVVSSNSTNELVQRPNLAAGLLAVLPALLDDLQSSRYGRRFVFWIYADSPHHSRINIRISEEDVTVKRLVRMARECEVDPGYEVAGSPPSLQVSVEKKYRWSPRKIKAQLEPSLRPRLIHSTARA